MIVTNWSPQRYRPMRHAVAPRHKIFTIAPDRAYVATRNGPRRSRASRPRRSGGDRHADNLHYPMAKTFVEAGFHVICDKPLTTTLQEALDLATIVKRSNVIFWTDPQLHRLPMVRQARQMIADGLLGKIRIVQVEYAQDWLATPLEQTGQKQAAWRTDPAQSGPGGSSAISARMPTISPASSPACVPRSRRRRFHLVPGRRLDDNVQNSCSLAEGAKGALWASQIATGKPTICGARVRRKGRHRVA